jgi:hypothetical protein
MAASEVCIISIVLCSVSDGHYTEFGNCSISDEEKERRTLGTRVSYLSKGRRTNETRISHLIKWRRALWMCVSPLFRMKKRIPTDCSRWDSPCTNTQYDRWHTYMHVCVLMVTLRARCKKHRMEHKLCDIFESLKLSWV